MAERFDQQETTLSYDEPTKTVELYTTNRRLWLRLIARNPNFIKAVDLDPGYLIVYPYDEVRAPETVFRQKEGGEKVAQRYMTPEEIESRRRVGLRIGGSKKKETEGDN